MPRFKAITSSFASGELSPGAQDQVESEAWSSGTETLENLLVRREGGVRVRPGVRPLVTGDLLQDEQDLNAAGQQGFSGFEDEDDDSTLRPGTWGTSDPVRLRIRGGGFIERVIGDEAVRDTYNSHARRAIDNRMGGITPIDGVVGPDLRAVRVCQWNMNPNLPVSSIDIEMSIDGVPTLVQSVDRTLVGARFVLMGVIPGMDGWWTLTPQSTPVGPTRWEAYRRLDPPLGLGSVNLALRTHRINLLPRPATLNGRATTPDVFIQRADGTKDVGYSRMAIVALGNDGTVFTDVSTQRGEKGTISINRINANFFQRDDEGEVNVNNVRTNDASRQTSVRAAIFVLLEGRAGLGDRDVNVRLHEWKEGTRKRHLITMSGSYTSLLDTTLQKPELEIVPRRKWPVDIQELSLCTTPQRVYAFHEDLDPPRMLSRDLEGNVAWRDVEFAVVEKDPGVMVRVPTSADDLGVQQPLWGPDGAGIRSGQLIRGRLALIGSGRNPGMVAFSSTRNQLEFVPRETVPDPDDNTKTVAITPRADDPFWGIHAGAVQFVGGIEGKRFVVFGENGEHYLPSDRYAADSFALETTGAHGSPTPADAVLVDDTILFRQGNEDIRAMVYTDEESGFRTPSVAPYSPHRVQGARAIAHQVGGDGGVSRVWVVLNDGTMSCLSIDRAAGLNAWCGIQPPRADREGEVLARFSDVAAVGGRVFTVMHVLGLPIVCEMSFDASRGGVLDLANVIPSYEQGDALYVQRTSLGLPLIPPGTMVRIVADRTVDGSDTRIDREVLEDGQVLLEGARIATGARVEIGLPVLWRLRTLPAVIRSATGTVVSAQKSRVVRTYADFEVDRGPMERNTDIERFIPGRKEWPRRVQVEDARGIWLPVITMPTSATERVVSCKFGARRGWKNRTSVAIQGDTPVSIMGLSYYVAAGA